VCSRVGALPLLATALGGDIDVRYEVFAISVADLCLILSGALLATMGVRARPPIPVSVASS
jgi:hypothetical protein